LNIEREIREIGSNGTNLRPSSKRRQIYDRFPIANCSTTKSPYSYGAMEKRGETLE
jgi:hypothetical protein